MVRIQPAVVRNAGGVVQQLAKRDSIGPVDARKPPREPIVEGQPLLVPQPKDQGLAVNVFVML